MFFGSINKCAIVILVIRLGNAYIVCKYCINNRT